MNTSPKPAVSRAALRAGVELRGQAPRVAEAAALLKSMSHADRLLLLCQLVDGELTVGELGERSGMQQPSLSQQLGVLRRERLVATRREGKFIHYRIASPAVLGVLTALYQEFCD